MALARLRPVRSCVLVLSLTMLAACEKAPEGLADPNDAAQVALGAKLYAGHCGACHGMKLEGQPNWQRRLANGRLPAPPHDESGHTWHHTDEVLFGITKHGLVPPYAPPGYQSDMPAFAGTLSDEEIRAVLAYIKSHWTNPELLAARAQMLRNTRKP